MNQNLVELMLSLASADMHVMKIDSTIKLNNYINDKGKRYFSRKELITSMIVEEIIIIVGGIELTADKCGVSVETIKKIKSGTRFPSKELWIKFGLLINIQGDFIAVFMRAAGYSLNTAILSELIYFYALNNRLTMNQTYTLLLENNCKSEANKFYK